MDNNEILAKHLCGGNEAITESLYKHFNDSDIWKSGEGSGSIIQSPSKDEGLALLNGAEGISAVASGCGTHANANYSHAEGLASMTLDTNRYPGWMDGVASHAEGNQTTAGGRASHAEGDGTITNNPGEHAEGRYNVSHFETNTWGSSGNTIHSIGIGTPSETLIFENSKNAFEIMQNGDAYLIGVGGYNGTNPSEASRLQDVIGGNSGLITVAKDLNLVYNESGVTFEINIPNTSFPTDFKTTPYRYNLIVEVHGQHETGELYGYVANHFCYMSVGGDGFTALCHDEINEGISHDTTIIGGEEGYDIRYTGFLADTSGQALPLEGSKVSVYLQRLG